MILVCTTAKEKEIGSFCHLQRLTQWCPTGSKENHHPFYTLKFGTTKK